MLEPSRERAVMIAAARLAGAGLMRHFRKGEELVVKEKGPADFVTSADLESQMTLFGALSSAFPHYGFLAEEQLGGHASSPLCGPRRGEAPDVPSGTRFVVDPLDGTSNFLHGIPHFAVAIALEKEGEVTAGVVFDPAKDEMFVAERDRGAWLGDSLLHVSTDADLSGALVGTGIPHRNSQHGHPQYLRSLAAVMREAAGVRRFAAAALDLAYVAAGRFAAFFEYGLARWDVAAGGLLVREAGGRVTEPDGGAGYLDSGNVLATNGRLHARVQSLLAAPRAASPPWRRRRWRRR